MLLSSQDQSQHGNTCIMHYWSRFPGNSCTAEHLEHNTHLRKSHMNPRILSDNSSVVVGSGLSDYITETCVKRSLSSIISEYFERQSAHSALDMCSIDLLKIDVEGSELSVLRSMSVEHWARVRQVVMETELTVVEQIEDLLMKHGFEVIVDQSDMQRGCCMVYARREL